MNKRWMKSIIETSKQPATALPFQRGTRKPMSSVMASKARKTA